MSRDEDENSEQQPLLAGAGQEEQKEEAASNSIITLSDLERGYIHEGNLEALTKCLQLAMDESNIGALKYLLLGESTGSCENLTPISDETRNALFKNYVTNKEFLDYVSENVPLPFFQRLEDKLLAFVYNKYIEQEQQEQQKQSINAEKAKEKGDARNAAIKIIQEAAKYQREHDKTRGIARNIASVAGVIIGSAVGIAVFALAAPAVIGIGAIAGTVLGGTAAWFGFGKLIGPGVADPDPNRSAMAPGADWGAIIGFAVGVFCATALGLVIPGAGVFLGLSAASYLVGAVGAVLGCAGGCAASYKIAQKIEHKTSKMVTNSATALGSIIGSVVGALVGTLLIPIPGIGTALGMAAGAAIGGLFLGGASYFKFRREGKTETEKVKQSDIPRKAAAGGGIAGAGVGAGIGAIIGTLLLPGIGTAIGASIGVIVGAISGGAISYREAAASQSKWGVAMSVGASIAGAKMGSMFGAGVGLLLTPVLGPLGPAAGFVIGGFLGSIFAGLRTRYVTSRAEKKAKLELITKQDTEMGFFDKGHQCLHTAKPSEVFTNFQVLYPPDPGKKKFADYSAVRIYLIEHENDIWKSKEFKSIQKAFKLACYETLEKKILTHHEESPEENPLIINKESQNVQTKITTKADSVIHPVLQKLKQKDHSDYRALIEYAKKNGLLNERDLKHLHELHHAKGDTNNDDLANVAAKDPAPKP